MKAWKKILSVMLSTTMVATAVPVITFAEPADSVDGDGYQVVFFDDFTGTTLDRSVWNVETHEKGWVNAELQEYVDSTDNIYLQDGKLVIQPVKDADGNITSGRISTQNKKTFTYGKFEVKAKVPEGQGYLPAFWLMSNDENIYGQWPRCGEIDCMEVMGQDPDTLYGTIHYGNPHGQKQGTYTVASGADFAEDFHVYTCEWEPGKITWYVDGNKYFETSDWYSRTEGQGEITYPAPFDQPFYMILNLAVGGSWVGYPEDDAVIDQPFVIDYVKVYQKENYDENVEKPEVVESYKEADAQGNYITNGTFAVAENLSDDVDWKFLTALGGEATADISSNEMNIATTNAGTVDYSVQLVQPNLPMYKGASYEVSFDAYADAERSMIVDISAPDRGYVRYLADTKVNLTTTKQTFTYSFTMTGDNDPNGRLEYNMGKQGSTAGIHISNVVVKKTADPDPAELNKKTVLADGNYVYNGKFQEGTNHMGDWNLELKNADASLATAQVTDFADGRRMKVTSADTVTALDDVKLVQKDLAVVPNKVYAFSFDAQADGEKDITVSVLGKEETVHLTAEKKSYAIALPAVDSYSNKDVVFKLGTPGTVLLDNVRLVEDTLIKNGSFDAGLSGYEVYVDGSATASYVVDSITEDSALDVTVNDTSDADWKIQVKQNNVPLINGKWYKLTFKAKSSLPRNIRVIMQGKEDRDWDVYSSDNTVALTDEFQTFTDKFQMTKDTDLEAFLSICLGKIDEKITTRHRVVIDDISLTEISAPVSADENLFKNADFANGFDNWTETIANWGGDFVTDASHDIADGAITYTIANPGTAEWHVQLKQSGISLVEGQKYKVSMNFQTSVTRTIKTCVMDTDYNFYGGTEQPVRIEAGKVNPISFEFTMLKDDPAADFVVSLGKMPDEATPAGTVTISDFTFVPVVEEAQDPEAPSEVTPGEENVPSDDQQLDQQNGQDGQNSEEVVAPVETVKDNGTNPAKMGEILPVGCIVLILGGAAAVVAALVIRRKRSQL